jgi:DNA ligase D-like protein (predicted 3'-phosphoesterase)
VGVDPVFVIQAHDTAQDRVHYDLRLEIDGVLKSWSIPRGPSTNPRVKRLAIPVDDQPLAFAEFEGVVATPDSEAGTVQIWDTGAYHNLKDIHGQTTMTMAQQLERGEILVRLEGQKLKGGFALIKLQNPKGGGNPWLLVKMRDEFASVRSRARTDESALTGRTLAEIKAGVVLEDKAKPKP